MQKILRDVELDLWETTTLPSQTIRHNIRTERHVIHFFSRPDLCDPDSCKTQKSSGTSGPICYVHADTLTQHMQHFLNFPLFKSLRLNTDCTVFFTKRQATSNLYATLEFGQRFSSVLELHSPEPSLLEDQVALSIYLCDAKFESNSSVAERGSLSTELG